MQEAKELNYSYRDYVENNNSIPKGTRIAQYQIKEEIGRGAFGKIFLAQNSRSEYFAAKLMDLEKVKEETNPKVKEIRWRLVKNEPTLMQQCNNPNVLKCYDIFENQSLKLLILEYCNGKTLQEYLQVKKNIGEEEAVRILRQIINGIAELHKHSIIHRDLKADNIMQHESEYKIIDLGFSKKLEITNELAEVKGTILGTVTTMAPEVLSKLSYGLKADIWSIGVIFFQMVFGVNLYDSMTARERIREIEKKKYFSLDKELTFNDITISKEANNFLYRVLEVDTEKRMGWRELIEHPLIKERQGPIGNRFLIKRELEEPQVDYEFKVRNSVSISLDASINNENQVNQFNSNPKKQVEINEIEPSDKKTQEPKKYKIDINFNTLKNKKEEKEQDRWEVQERRLNEETKPKEKKKKQVEHVRREKLEDSEELRWVKQGHLECLKTQLVYNQLIIPIENEKLLDLGAREVVEFMFLISARCFNNMSPISHKISTETNKSNVIVKNLYEQVKQLYKKVYEKFQFYSTRLTQIESGFFEMFLDFFRKRFLKKNYDERSSYTSGIELSHETEEEKKRRGEYGDYSKREQVNYTYNSYVPNMIKKLKTVANAEKVVGYLTYYDKIMNVTLSDLDGQTFSEYVRRIVM